MDSAVAGMFHTSKIRSRNRQGILTQNESGIQGWL
jgi:hypothetical protein